MDYYAKPENYGGFQIPYTGQEGYYNYSLGIPYYVGRSTIASIPEYLRSPWLLENDLIIRLGEGRQNLLRLLLEFVGGKRIERPDVKYRIKVEIADHGRFYLANGTYDCVNMRTVLKLTDFNRPKQSYPTKSGNPKVVGDIARIQEGDFLLLMFSWTLPGRVRKPVYGEPNKSAAVPEIAKVVAVNYDTREIIVQRMWAGRERTESPETPDSFTVGAAANNILPKEAFFIRLPNSMPEDEIDAKVYSKTMTWTEGIMQRSLKAWGAGVFQEVINANLGHESPYAKNRREAIEEFFKDKEWAALFGEMDEGFDPETNAWWGVTDGLLTKIPKEHYIAIKPIDYSNVNTAGWMGSFQIPIFNKILENKGYVGSPVKVLLCGQDFYTDFSVMINQMTQNIPEIKSDWGVVGRSFTSSGGLTINVVPSDTMTLNGLRKYAILFDPQYFVEVGLKGYPTDIVEVQNENPLKRNGFIHGVYSFINTNPDAHWVFVLDKNVNDLMGEVIGQ